MLLPGHWLLCDDGVLRVEVTNQRCVGPANRKRKLNLFVLAPKTGVEYR